MLEGSQPLARLSAVPNRLRQSDYSAKPLLPAGRPIDLRRLNKVNSATGRPTKLLTSLIAGSSEDDVSILWLKNSSNTNTAVSMLEANAASVQFGEIFAGPSMKLRF